MEKISNVNFSNWKKDPVTKSVFAALSNVKKELNAALAAADIILGPKETQARMLGTREGIDLILNITIEDVVDEEEIIQ